MLIPSFTIAWPTNHNQIKMRYKLTAVIRVPPQWVHNWISFSFGHWRTATSFKPLLQVVSKYKSAKLRNLSCRHFWGIQSYCWGSLPPKILEQNKTSHARWKACGRTLLPQQQIRLYCLRVSTKRLCLNLHQTISKFKNRFYHKRQCHLISNLFNAIILLSRFAGGYINLCGSTLSWHSTLLSDGMENLMT